MVIDCLIEMQRKQKYYFFLNAFLGILFSFSGLFSLFAQIPADSLISNDLNPDTTVIQRQYVRFSKDSLSAPIDASCKDSMILDNKIKSFFFMAMQLLIMKK